MICAKCGDEVKEDKFLYHLREFHQGEKDLNAKCPACQETFQTVPTIQKHWYSYHHMSKKKPPASSNVEGAPLVPVVLDSESAPKRPRVEESDESIVVPVPVDSQCISDLKVTNEPEPMSLSHSEEPGQMSPSQSSQPGPMFILESGVPGVRDQEVSSTISREIITPEDDECIEENQESVVESESSESSESDESEGEVLEEGHAPSVTKSNVEPANTHVNQNAAEFLLCLKEKCNVPIKCTSELIAQTETLVSGALQTFASTVEQKLKCSNISLSNFLDVEDSVKASIRSLFDNLRTDHQQNQYFKRTLGIIEPLKYPLGREFRRVRRKGKRAMQTVIVQEEFLYVPVEKVVEKLISHPDYKKMVEEGAACCNSDVLDSYMKGEKWKKNCVLKEHPDALRFILYYDDLEVCSPLKSKAGKNKLGAFYLYIDNIPLKYRSNLDLIVLVGLVNANLVKGKKYGVDVVLEHIVNCLKRFEDGLMLSNGKKVYGTLIAVIGDNLGAHAIGGFKEGFTAHRPCRNCMATYEELQQMTAENVDLLRDKDSHSKQCEKVQTSRGKNEKLSTEFGINRDSALNSLRSYHVIQGLPPDLLHDILEGCLPLTVKKLLNHHLYAVKPSERKFTLEWLNSAIRDFDYGPSEVMDKPSELKKDYITDDSSSLHQSGSQMWLLATILPLIIGPLISVHDKQYQNFLDVLEISRIVFSSEISKWLVIYLKDLIEMYLTDFISLYGSLIPKQHYLLHYPEFILLLGPLLNYNCMRCEAKHKYFKKIVNALGNYKHVPWTLTSRHQLSQSVSWRKSLFKKPKVGPFYWINVSDASYRNLLPPNTLKVLETGWLEFNGVKFVKEKSFICIGSNDSIPEFAKVMKVLIYPVCQFVCQKVCTRRKNVHLAAFEVELLTDFCLVLPKQMILPKVFYTHRALQKDFVVMKQCAKDALF